MTHGSLLLLTHFLPSHPSIFIIQQEVESGGVTIRTRQRGQLGLYEVEELVAGLGQAVADTKELHEILEVRAEEVQEKEKEKEGV